MQKFNIYRLLFLGIFIFCTCFQKALAQDTTASRKDMKGIALGVNFNPFNIGNSSFDGKYWINDQQTLLASLRFTIFDNPTIYRRDTSVIAIGQSNSASLSWLVGTEYHFTKNQTLSPFARVSLAMYSANVPGFNDGKLFDSGSIFLTPGFGLEYFITKSISISVLQSIEIWYAWSNGAQSRDNPSILVDSRLFRLNAASTYFLFNIYF